MSTTDSRNDGHGHVTPRPDGFRSRCGGPAMCVVCQRERAALEAASAPVIPDRVLSIIAKQKADSRMEALNTATERYLRAEIDRLHAAILAASVTPPALHPELKAAAKRMLSKHEKTNKTQQEI